MDITAKIYNDEDAARAHLEAQLWPDGPVCPHCGSFASTPLYGKAHRRGLHQCNEPECREQFSVTVGTVFERSKIPLHKWVLAAHHMGASKKGISSKQIQRMLGVTYKSAWFMTMRLREAMTEAGPSRASLSPKNMPCMRWWSAAARCAPSTLQT
jgi:transposase-like protein